MAEQIKQMILQEEDGTLFLEIDFPIAIDKDKTSTEIIRLIDPFIMKENLQITEMSKKGYLEYNITLMHQKTRKHKMYKLRRKLVEEEDVFISVKRTESKIATEKEKMKAMSMSELVIELNKLEKLEKKDNLTTKDIMDLKRKTLLEDEQTNRIKKLEEVLKIIKVGKKNSELVVWMATNLKDTIETA